MHKSYSTPEFATEFDITNRTIRFYEKKGLLNPHRTGQLRVYSNADRTRLKLISRGKHLGFSLDESRDIIDMYDPAHNNVELLNTLLNKVHEKRVQLEQQLHDITSMMLELQGAEKKCLQSLAKNQAINTALSHYKTQD